MNGVLPVAAAQPSPRLWPSVIKLLRLRWVIFFSGFKRAKTRRKIGMIAIGLLILAFLGFIFFLSWTLLGFLRSPRLAAVAGDVQPLLESIPSLLMGGAFLGILLTSFGVLLQALYLAGDMDFLLAAPVPIRAVFLAKLLQAILPNFSLICLFALPVLWGIGAAAGYNLLYYPLVLAELAALALAAAGLASLLVMGVVRVFPARRVAEVLGFIGAISSFLCSQTGQLANWDGMEGVQAGEQLVDLTSRFNTPLSPLTWAGRGLVELGQGRWLSGGVALLLTLGLSAGIFVLTLGAAERLYYSGWAGLGGVARKKRPARRPAKTFRLPLAGLAERLLPPVVRGLIVKDALVLRRDLRNLSQLVTPLIFGLVYGFVFLRSGGEPPEGRGEAPAAFMEVLRLAWVYGNVGISLFVSWMLLGRLAGMGFSQEGRSYWILKTAPVRPAQLLAAKFLVAYLPSLVLGWLFLVVISLLRPGGAQTLPFTLPVVALSIAGNTGFNLALGVVGARFDWDDPRHMVKGTTGCLAPLASLVYLALDLALFFGPPLFASLFGLSQIAGQLAGLVLGGAFSLAAGLLPLLWSARRINRFGE